MKSIYFLLQTLLVLSAVALPLRHNSREPSIDLHPRSSSIEHADAEETTVLERRYEDIFRGPERKSTKNKDWHYTYDSMYGNERNFPLNSEAKFRWELYRQPDPWGLRKLTPPWHGTAANSHIPGMPNVKLRGRNYPPKNLREDWGFLLSDFWKTLTGRLPRTSTHAKDEDIHGCHHTPSPDSIRLPHYSCPPDRAGPVVSRRSAHTTGSEDFTVEPSTVGDMTNGSITTEPRPYDDKEHPRGAPFKRLFSRNQHAAADDDMITVPGRYYLLKGLFEFFLDPKTRERHLMIRKPHLPDFIEPPDPLLSTASTLFDPTNKTFANLYRKALKAYDQDQMMTAKQVRHRNMELIKRSWEYIRREPCLYNNDWCHAAWGLVPKLVDKGWVPGIWAKWKELNRCQEHLGLASLGDQLLVEAMKTGGTRSEMERLLSQFWDPNEPEYSGISPNAWD